MVIQPLIDWLRAASFKAKASHKNTTETPIYSNWSVSCLNREETHWARTRIAELFGNRTPKFSRSQIATTTHRQRVVDRMQNLSQSSTTELIAIAVAKTMLTMGLIPLRDGVQNTNIPSSTKEKCQNIAYIVLKDGVESTTIPLYQSLQYGKS